MHIAETVASVRERVAQLRAQGRSVALVPTMGALHEGHLALIRAAGEDGSAVIVSVFVNPTQFNDAADLAKYPRDPQADAALAAQAGADTVFLPSVEEVYPSGFSTSIRVSGVSELWEGATRGASHFDGVALVVTKLFLMVGPDNAWFGAKDAQQVAVVRRAVADLNIPVAVRTMATVRAQNGLALSSRNQRLRPEDQPAALSLSASLRSAQESAAAGMLDAAWLARRGEASLAEAGARVEYWAVVEPLTLEPLERLVPGEPALAIVAAWVGDVRLIDNAQLLAP